MYGIYNTDDSVLMGAVSSIAKFEENMGACITSERYVTVFNRTCVVFVLNGKTEVVLFPETCHSLEWASDELLKNKGGE